MTKDNHPEKLVGYANPPQNTRFKKGRSGNPRGRPKAKSRGAPYAHVFERVYTITVEGAPTRLSGFECFLKKLGEPAVKDNTRARSVLLELLNEEEEIRLQEEEASQKIVFRITPIAEIQRICRAQVAWNCEKSAGHAAGRFLCYRAMDRTTAD